MSFVNNLISFFLFVFVYILFNRMHYDCDEMMLNRKKKKSSFFCLLDDSGIEGASCSCAFLFSVVVSDALTDKNRE